MAGERCGRDWRKEEKKTTYKKQPCLSTELIITKDCGGARYKYCVRGVYGLYVIISDRSVMERALELRVYNNAEEAGKIFQIFFIK